MRISDWSSDVCSSDLTRAQRNSCRTTPRRWWTTCRRCWTGSTTTSSPGATTTPAATASCAWMRPTVAWCPPSTTSSSRALGDAAGKPVKAENLPLKRWSIEDDGRIALTALDKDWRCDLSGSGACVEKTGEPGVASPDGTQEAFIRDWNLWLRNLATGAETQLTTDGAVDYGYATDNAGWKHTDKAILVWSPDSAKIATFKQDQRRTRSEQPR